MKLVTPYFPDSWSYQMKECLTKQAQEYLSALTPIAFGLDLIESMPNLLASWGDNGKRYAPESIINQLEREGIIDDIIARHCIDVIDAWAVDV